MIRILVLKDALPDVPHLAGQALNLACGAGLHRATANASSV